MAKVNKTKYALLGVLSLMSGSGYDIKKFCDSSIGYFWNENYGHIYPVLQRMEDEELITKEVKQTEGRPAKNVYSITQKGRDELQEWLMLPVEQEPMRSEFLLKMFLSKDIPAEIIVKKLKTIKEKSKEELKQYSEIADILGSQLKNVDKKSAILYISTVNYGKKIEEAKIEWYEETIKALEELEN
ncbi:MULTISPECIES: PadR family transcriptional regulator [unclassified Clostridium]|uniref:PadR family transcriptional regulator n=1 Tax=unclassified Clostridium TaxID=2614128 RepID=UPI00029763B8|nr:MULTISPECIES: PadR family transcriptional regulator [unclassified Clostridium]EKQ51702.1 MAG: putative transcriptional regulator [Clostridium sp. Maddingley MBC34-26]